MWNTNSDSSEMRSAISAHSKAPLSRCLLLLGCGILAICSASSAGQHPDVVSARRYIDPFEFDRLQTDLVRSKLVLLDQQTVREHLGVSSQQLDSIRELVSTPVRDIPGVSDLFEQRKARQESDSVGQTTVQTYRTALQQLIAKYHEKGLSTILNAPQLDRLSELLVQMRGPVILMHSPWKGQIALSEKQALRIKEALSTADKKVQPLLAQYFRSFIGGSEGDLSREKIANRLREYLQARDGAILSILTDDQREKFRSFQGTKFAIQWQVDEILKDPFQ